MVQIPSDNHLLLRSLHKCLAHMVILVILNAFWTSAQLDFIFRFSDLRLLCCRANRLPKTDMQLKQDAAFKKYVKKKKRSCSKHKRLNLKKKLRYLVFGNLKVKSPNSSFDEAEDDHKKRAKKGGLFGFGGKSKREKSRTDSNI